MLQTLQKPTKSWFLKPIFAEWQVS